MARSAAARVSATPAAGPLVTARVVTDGWDGRAGPGSAAVAAARAVPLGAVELGPGRLELPRGLGQPAGLQLEHRLRGVGQHALRLHHGLDARLPPGEAATPGAHR